MTIKLDSMPSSRAAGSRRKAADLSTHALGRLRVELLRFVALVILVGNLALGSDHGARLQAVVVVFYLTVSTTSALTVLLNRDSRWLRTLFVVLDAVAVAMVLYAQLLQAPVDHAHNLTTTGLVVAFILLNHVGLSADRWLVAIFSSIIIASWVAALGAMALRHVSAESGSFLDAFVNRDLGLATSFAFTAFAVYIAARDHGRSRERAESSDRRRSNLARFFSPLVVSQLEDASPSVRLERRRVAVMFVDLRGFTAFAEAATAKELTYVLSRYREITSEIILRHGGTVDKYMGDGVMAVFGHPVSRADDADRALAASLELVAALSHWKRSADSRGLPALRAGIGLHVGTVMGGILDAGCHSEFTVVGDAVNVAQRLQTVSKSFGASLVVSTDVLARLSSAPPDVAWEHANDVEIPGRSLCLNVAYLSEALDRQRAIAVR